MKTYIDETGKYVSNKPNRFQIGLDLFGNPIFNDSWIFSKDLYKYENDKIVEYPNIIRCYDSISNHYISSCVVIDDNDISKFNLNKNGNMWNSSYNKQYEYMYEYFNTKYKSIEFKIKFDYVSIKLKI